MCSEVLHAGFACQDLAVHTTIHMIYQDNACEFCVHVNFV